MKSFYPPPLSPDRSAARHAREWGVLLLVLALLGGAVAYWLGRAHTANRLREHAQLQIQARVIEENLVRQLQGANSALNGVRYDLFYGDTDGVDQHLQRRLQVLVDAMPGVRALIVLNRDGRVVESNRKDLLGKDFHARTYFALPQAQLDYAALYVSPPFLSVLNVYVVALSKAVSSDDGLFAGVIFATLDPEYFDIVARSVIYAPDMVVSIVHGDGKEFLVAPPTGSPQDMDLNVAGSLFRQHVDSGRASSNFMGRSASDPRERIVAMRNIQPAELRMNKPLTVAVSRDLAAIDASWRIDALASAGVFGALCAGTCLAMGYVHNRRRALKQAHDSAQQALEETVRRFEFGLKGADLGLWDWDIPNDTLTINERQWHMLGYTPEPTPLRAAFWQSLIHPMDAPAVHAAFLIHAKGLAPGYRLEHRMLHQDGRWIWVLSHAMVIERDAAGRATRILGTHLDISERKQADAELQRANTQLAQLSITDGLTGVGNRRLFDQCLQAEWARSARQKQPLALLMIDIDHFKLYNDCYGHPGGDACLREVAQILTTCLCRPGELLMRYGGEEFVVLLLDTDATGACVVAQRCLDRIRLAGLPHAASPVSDCISLSMGVAGTIPGPNSQPETLVAQADKALYQAKHQGRDRYVCTPSTLTDAP
ncbi:diguanylate cyclase [Rhodoferax sp. WC2427]|uniref:sensor domain-containing diguanylate cyclase n=1 Tax=Rhodoferax sp. WC2427 TaxID=3234144 RepID=UPI003465B263